MRAFRATHPLKHIIVDGVGWDYIASGEGERRSFSCLAGRWSASPCSRIPTFEDRYRIIAPSYASVPTAVQLLDGLAGILDAEECARRTCSGLPTAGWWRSASCVAIPSG